jgi:hypothetical protein
MKTKLVLFGLIAVVCSAVRAQTPSAVPFEIKDVKRGINPQVFVDSAWKRNVPVIEVKLSTSEDLTGKKPFVKAYFYDKDRKLITKAGRPSNYTEGNSTASLPDYLKPKETYKVCFGLTEQMLDVHRKWTRVVIVFGEGSRAAAEIYPTDDLKLFEFDEKSFATTKRK